MHETTTLTPLLGRTVFALMQMSFRQFWEEMVNMGNTKCIPITVRGDGTPVCGLGKTRSLLLHIWHWKLLLPTGRTLDVCFYIFAIFERMLLKLEEDRTFTRMHRRLQCSYSALWTGRWHTADENGIPFEKAPNPTFPRIVTDI